MRDKKKIVIGVLCALVGIMAVGYAALATRLNITGTASIDSTWKVEITNITEGNIVGDATSKEVPSYTATTANFSVGLIQPTDSITYDIEISNLGTLKAKVDSINVVMDNNGAITYTTSGVVEGDKLGVNEKATLSVTVAYDSRITSQPENTVKNIVVTINYVQDLGEDTEVNPSPAPSYEAYSIGDTVNFAGSNWYVIKDSTSDEDYVTLMKETVLTNAELGEYASSDTADTMEYYWDDDCHNANHGYTTSFQDSCSGHNDYEGSKVKELLEGTYINTLGADNLKEIDGYKIRLITKDDLINNLGWSSFAGSITSGSASPSWVVDNGYWTMSASGTNGIGFILSTNGYGSISYAGITNTKPVRPVINLLKSSI